VKNGAEKIKQPGLSAEGAEGPRLILPASAVSEQETCEKAAKPFRVTAVLRSRYYLLRSRVLFAARAATAFCCRRALRSRLLHASFGATLERFSPRAEVEFFCVPRAATAFCCRGTGGVHSWYADAVDASKQRRTVTLRLPRRGEIRSARSRRLRRWRLRRGARCVARGRGSARGPDQPW
jgi:hypothetical protein